jgi:hypothetical protein
LIFFIGTTRQIIWFIKEEKDYCDDRSEFDYTKSMLTVNRCSRFIFRSNDYTWVHKLKNFFGEDGPRGRESAQKKKKKEDKKQPCCSEATSTAQRKKKRIHGCLSPNPIRFLLSSSKKTLGTSSRSLSREDPLWLISVQVQILSNGEFATVKVQLWILPADSETTESPGDRNHRTTKIRTSETTATATLHSTQNPPS